MNMKYEKPQIELVTTGLRAIQGEKAPMGNPEPPKHTVASYEADE
jgi:hypothetical protein